MAQDRGEPIAWRRNKRGGLFPIFADGVRPAMKDKKLENPTDVPNKEEKHYRIDTLRDKLVKRFGDIHETSVEDADYKANDSLARNVVNGKLSNERECLHLEIIDKFFDGKKPTDGEKTYYMTGGGPASGKGTFAKDTEKWFGAKDDSNVVKIDSDEIKKMLPEFNAIKDGTKRAEFLHEESSALAKRIQTIGLENGYEVLLDGTGDGSERSLMKKIAEAKRNGYKVKARYSTVSFENAIERNRLRYEHALEKGLPARKVPDETVIKTHVVVSRLLQNPEITRQFDSIELWDNNGKAGDTKLIATGGNGVPLTPKPVSYDEWKDFIAKGNYEP